MTKLHGLRFRLTLWYSLALFLATGVIFAGFYLVTREMLLKQTDITLFSHGESIVQAVTAQEQVFPPLGKETFPQEFKEIPGMIVIITDNLGQIVSSSFPLESDDNLAQDLYQQTLKNGRITYKNKSINSEPVRFISIPINKDNGLQNMVMVAHPIDVIEKAMRNLILVLTTVFAFLMLPVMGGGFLLAKGAIKPIDDISRQLNEISSEDLNKRVSLPRADNEIKKLVRTFNDLLDRLSAAFRRERQFIGDVAHELMTPLTIQRSQIEIFLSKDRPRDQYKRALKELLTDNIRISAILKDILDLAWSESDNTKTTSQTFDLSQLLEEIADLAEKIGQVKNIVLKTQITKNITVPGKREKIFRAILNLIDNAIKYSHPGGKITICLKKIPNYAQIEIKDQGKGIPKEELPFVFDRFYRGSNIKGTTGSGLGLSIASAIIHAHKGKIQITSGKNKGTVISLWLPL